MKKIAITILFLFAIHNSTFCQDSEVVPTSVQELNEELRETDDESKRVELLFQIAFQYTYHSKDSAMVYLAKGKSLNKDLISYKGNALEIETYAALERNEGNFSKADSLFQEAEKIYIKNEDWSSIVKTKLSRGQIYLRLNDTETAEEIITRGLELAQQTQDIPSEVKFLGLMGQLNEQKNELNKALEYTNQSLDIAHQNNLTSELGHIYLDIQFITFAMDEYPKAISAGKAAADYFKENGDFRNQATALSNIGLISENIGDFQQAEEYLLKALEVKRSFGDKVSIAYTLLG